MDTGAYPRTSRRALGAGGLVGLACGPQELCEPPPSGATWNEVISFAAGLIEGIPDEELAGLVVDCSEVAGDLEQPAAVRKFAAALAGVAESVVEEALAGWDGLAALGAATCDLRQACDAGP